MIPSYTSIDLELRLSNSDATSLLCERNRLRLRQLPFCTPPPFRWQPFTLQRRADEVNPKSWSSLHKMRETTTEEDSLFRPATITIKQDRSYRGAGSMLRRCALRNPTRKTRSARTDHRRTRYSGERPHQTKKRPLRAAAAVRCLQHRGGPGRQPGSIQKRTRVRSMQR